MNESKTPQCYVLPREFSFGDRRFNLRRLASGGAVSPFLGNVTVHAPTSASYANPAAPSSSPA
jgi:hypothetical protein